VKPINVNIIGVGGGVSYDVSGPTHHCLEDISIMRLLPNLVVFSPSDWKLAEAFVGYSIHVKSPKYIRFDGKPLPPIYENSGDMDFDRGFCELVKGERACLVSTGYMTHSALRAAREIHNVGVIDMFMLKPVNEVLLYEVLRRYEFIITIEEAFINNGGLDSAISKVLCDNQSNARIKRLGFDDKYVFDLGNRDHFHAINGLDEKSIIAIVREYENSISG
jgi:transketolase